jgi:hypothetical protein
MILNILLLIIQIRYKTAELSRADQWLSFAPLAVTHFHPHCIHITCMVIIHIYCCCH